MEEGITTVEYGRNEPLVLSSISDGVCTITFNRPEALNAYNRELLLELESALIDFKHNDSARAAILTGAGRAFCAGADLKQISAFGDGKLLYQRESGEPIRSLQSYDLDIEKPLIAAVNGHALAGGLVMALACDIRIASSSATFGFPMVKHGFTPAAGAYFIARSMPLSAAMEMALTGDAIGADEALRFGLVSRVVEPDELMSSAVSLARRICAVPPDAVKYTKRTFLMTMHEAIRPGIEMAEMLFGMAAANDDSKEGVQAWIGRRPPNAGASQSHITDV